MGNGLLELDGELRIREAFEADYAHWLDKPFWDALEASLLLGGFVPEELPEAAATVDRAMEVSQGWHERIVNGIKNKQLQFRIPPTDWIKWARDIAPLPVRLAIVLQWRNNANRDDQTASPSCAAFHEMDQLRSNEVKIDLAAGESGTLILRISARGISRSVPTAEFGLTNKTNGELNQQGGLLLGLAGGRKAPIAENKQSKGLSRLRKLLMLHLGLADDPLPLGQPVCTITDSRGAADERAKREAQRKMHSYNDNLNKEYDDEDDEAGQYLRDYDLS